MKDDLIRRQAAIKVILDDKIGEKSLVIMRALGSENEAKSLNMACDRHVEFIKEIPSAQPERTCVNCGRTVNNGGWYADGRTRCPIEEYYALPKDGFCHLWEKRNVTDDDYPRRTDKQTPLRRKEEGRAEGR